jgi:hypothetical protein
VKNDTTNAANASLRHPKGVFIGLNCDVCSSLGEAGPEGPLSATHFDDGSGRYSIEKGLDRRPSKR